MKSLTQLNGVQILRGLAAFFVLLHHVLEESQPLFKTHISDALVLFGACGVDIFFVISGFIIFYSVTKSRKKTSVKDFVLKRLIRILPLYWACSLFVVALKELGLFASKTVTWESVLGSLFFVEQKDLLIGVGWTLNYEMYFYSVMAFCLLFFHSERLLAASVLLIVSFVLCLSNILNQLMVVPLPAFFSNPLVVEFCFGILLAYFYKHLNLAKHYMCPIAVLSLTTLFAASIWGPTDGTTAGLSANVRYLFWGIPSLGLVLSSLYFKFKSDGVIMKFLLLLGDASYAIYLTHSFVMVAYARLIKEGLISAPLFGLSLFLPIIVSLLAGIFTHLWFEKPVMKALKKWHRQRAAKPSVPKKGYVG